MREERIYQDTKGHVWKTAAYDENEPDIFAYAVGNHNGPECVNCGYSFCHHCLEFDDIPICKKPATKPHD